MIKESRLLRFANLSNFKDKTRYNSRNADANATIQDASANVKNLQAQRDTIQVQRREILAEEEANGITEDTKRQHTVLTNSATRIDAALKQNATDSAGSVQQLGIARSTYNNAAQGFGSTAVTTAKAGDMIGSGTQSVGTGNGLIQKSAVDTIKSQHPEWTDAQIMQQISGQQAGIKSTMSDSGQGVEYYKNGVTVPGSAGSMYRNDPNAAAVAGAKAASDAKIAGIKGSKTIQTGTQPDGTPIYQTVEDPAETARLQQEAKTAAETKAAADANYGASMNNKDAADTTPGNAGAGTGQNSPTMETKQQPEDVPPPSTPESFLGGLDALEQQYAGTALAPLFEFYKGQYMELQAKGMRGEQLMSAIQARTDKYVAQQQADMGAMSKAWGAMYDKIQQSQLESAKRTYDQQTRLAEQQKKEDQIAYDRAIRDQNIKNEEDRQSLLLDNGISGGWRSSMHTAKMIDAFKKAENIVADLRVDQINNGDKWADKILSIEGDFHNNITAAYDAHNVNLLQLQDKLSARAQQIDKTVFDNDVNQLNAISKNTEEWYAGVSDIAKNTTNTVIQAQKDTAQAIKDAKAELKADKVDFRSRYQFQLSTFGNTDPIGYAALVEEAKSLGISIPTSAPETLEQKAAVVKALQDNMTLDFAPRMVNGVDITPIVNTISNQQNSDSKSMLARQDLQHSLDTGNMDEFMNKAVSYGMERLGVAAQTEIKDSLKGLTYTADAAAYLPGLEGTSLWKSLKQMNINTALGQHKDEAWLLALGKFQIASAKIVQDISGKQVVSNEEKRLVGILSQRGDTVEDIATKLKLAHSYFQTSYDVNATIALGLGYGSAVKNGQIVKFGAGVKKPEQQDDMYDDDPGMTENGPTTMNSGAGSGLSIDTSTRVSALADTQSQKVGFMDWAQGTLGGKISAGYDSPHLKNQGIVMAKSDNGLHGGVDIAIPVNSPIKPLVGGKVVSLSGSNKDKKGWGLSLTLEDNQGVFHKYSHLNNVPQYIRDAIARGENPIIGTDNVFAFSGNSGNSTGPHLDYRARTADGKWIHVDDHYANPVQIANTSNKKSNA